MDARKKILYVITKSNWGGAQRYVYDLATSLPSNEYDVAVAVGGDGLLAEKLREKNIRVFAIRNLQRDVSVVKEFRAAGELRALCNTFRPDVVHLNSSKAGGLGALAARFAHVPKIIFTAHGWPFWEPRNVIQKMLIWFFSYLTVALSHATVCISEHDARVGRRMPFVKRKIHVVRNGIAPYTLLPRDDARAKLFNVSVIEAHINDVWVLTNAELTKNKNVRTGIDAVLLHNRTSAHKIFYTIMGDGEQRDELEKYVAEKNAGGSIVLLGFVPDGRTYYKGFDIFLLPSLKEGVPYVLLEAGVAEIPCIATDTGGIPEVLENEKNGFVEPKNDVSALAKSLGRLAEDKALRDRIGKAHQEKILTEYSSSHMLAATKALYA